MVCLSVLNKSKLVDAAKNGRLINVFHCQEVKEVGGIYVTKKPVFVGVFNPNIGERYINLSQVIAWTLDDSKLLVTLPGTYSQNEEGQGDCEFLYFRDTDMGFDALVERLKSMSEKLWEE